MLLIMLNKNHKAKQKAYVMQQHKTQDFQKHKTVTLKITILNY